MRNANAFRHPGPDPDKRSDDAHISVLAGSFEQPAGITSTRHIFCTGKGGFHEISDGLPQYEKGSAGLLVAE